MRVQWARVEGQCKSAYVNQPIKPRHVVALVAPIAERFGKASQNDLQYLYLYPKGRTLNKYFSSCVNTCHVSG